MSSAAYSYPEHPYLVILKVLCIAVAVFFICIEKREPRVSDAKVPWIVASITGITSLLTFAHRLLVDVGIYDAEDREKANDFSNYVGISTSVYGIIAVSLSINLACMVA